MELATSHAHPALDTFLWQDDMRLPRESGNGIGRAVPGAKRATDTDFRIDRVGQQGLALLGPAGMIPNVFQILVIKIVQSGQNRVR